MTPRRVSVDWADHVPTRPEIEPTVHIERRDPGLLRECLTIINACLVVPGSVTWGGIPLRRCGTRLPMRVPVLTCPCKPGRIWS